MQIKNIIEAKGIKSASPLKRVPNNKLMYKSTHYVLLPTF